VDFLRQLGLPFRQAAPGIDERVLPGETPREHVRRLARAKARAVSERADSRWVLAADTVVAVGSSILGKPRDERHARQMVRRLSGRWHQVWTAMALRHASPAGKSIDMVEVSRTRVRFRSLKNAEIRWYVGTGEPMDKAGAYAIQGKGGFLIDRIEGSPTNVIGFPLEALFRLLHRAGLSWPLKRD
jgi:septum formation protein